MNLLKTVIQNKFIARNIPAIKNFLFFLGWEGEKGGGREEGGGREPTAVHLPCARSHSNASMLATVLVDRFFPYCLVVRRGERKRDRARARARVTEGAREKEKEKEKEERK